MSNYYDIDDLTARVSNHVVYNTGNPELNFKPGNVLEVISERGKDLIKKATVSILTEDLEQAKDNSRKLLAEKHTNMMLRKKLKLNKEEEKHYNDKIDKLQSDYQQSYKVVQEIQSYLEQLQ